MYDNGRLSCDEVKRVIEIQSKCHQSVEVFDRHSTYQWKSGEFFTSSTSPCHSLRWKVTVARLYLSWSHQIFVKQIPALSIIKIFSLSPRRSCLSLLPSLLSSHLTEFFHFCPHLFHIPFILSRFHPQDFFVSSTTRDSERKWRDRSEPVRVILRCRSMNDIFDIKKKNYVREEKKSWCHLFSFFHSNRTETLKYPTNFSGIFLSTSFTRKKIFWSFLPFSSSYSEISPSGRLTALTVDFTTSDFITVMCVVFSFWQC